jgi:cytochrome o ubiquinol oxidase subunit 3
MTTQAEQKTHKAETNKTIFGFWVYIMTDCVLFATLFATYAVLHNNTFGGPGARELFSMPFVLAETLILLTSSFTIGLAVLAARQKRLALVYSWLAVTFILGAAFLGLELHEFNNLVSEGHSWRASAFLSAFFTLVGTHGLHITSGLIWMTVLIAQIFRKGFTGSTLKRLALFSLFWHFLDIVWVFIFTIVYLLGASA